MRPGGGLAFEHRRKHRQVGPANQIDRPCTWLECRNELGARGIRHQVVDWKTGAGAGTFAPLARAHPMVTGPPGARFHAAAPITTVDSYRLGAVDVLGNRPRRITPSGSPPSPTCHPGHGPAGTASSTHTSVPSLPVGTTSAQEPTHDGPACQRTTDGVGAPSHIPAGPARHFPGALVKACDEDKTGWQPETAPYGKVSSDHSWRWAGHAWTAA